MSAWGGLAALALAASAPALRLHVDSDGTCVLASAVTAALAEQSVATSTDASAWQLVIRERNGQLLVRLVDQNGAVRGERSLRASASDCDTLNHTVAVLVTSWLTAKLSPAPAPSHEKPPSTEVSVAEVPAPARRVEPTPTPRAQSTTRPTPLAALAPATPDAPPPAPTLALGPAAPETVVAREVTAAPEPPPPAVPAPSPELTSPVTAAASPSPEPPKPVAVAALPPPPVEPPFVRSLSVMLSGGGAVDPQDAVASVSLGVEWSPVEPWGIGFDGGVESERTRKVDQGTVKADLQWATLSARRIFFARGLTGLHLGLGVRLVHVHAWGEHFTTNNPRDTFTGAALANVEWRQGFTRGFFGFARFTAQARFQQLSFYVGGLPGDLLTIPQFGLGLSLGLGWNFL